MPRVELSEQAEADYDSMVDVGLRLFGPIQAALATIEANPRAGTSRWVVRPGVLGLHLKQPGHPASHIVFYRYVVETDVVQGLRVLHQSADFDTHFP